MYTFASDKQTKETKQTANMIKRLTPILFLLLLTGCHSTPKAEDSGTKTATEAPKTRTDSIGMLVAAVRNNSRLYTSEFHVHKIITHSDESRLKGSILGMKYDIGIPVGSRRIAIPIDATLKGYIDFSDFSSGNVIFDENRIEIILPDPAVEITSAKINHDEIKSYVALLRKDFSDKELSQFEAQGRDSILADVPSLKIAERTRSSAANILVPMMRKLGFSNDDIVVTFNKNFDEQHLRTTIN
jgi:hypothetical protein